MNKIDALMTATEIQKREHVIGKEIQEEMCKLILPIVEYVLSKVNK